MRARAVLCLGLGLTGLLLAGVAGRAQNPPPSEYQIKAAFLFNFAKFVQWPSNDVPTDATPIVIGILGDNSFHAELEQTIRGKTVDAHPLVIKEFASVTPATNCQILFISTSEKKRLPEIFATLKGTSVLTVGETDGFIKAGGMVNFTLEGSKIRFQINNDAATRARLKISSKLLSLALPGS